MVKKKGLSKNAKSAMLIAGSSVAGALISKVLDLVWNPNNPIITGVLIAIYSLFVALVLYLVVPRFGNWLS
ncbi:MAG: hypothetical protein WCT52_00395 [Candidatus Micrarchaeia archaeon]|jgi:hypothetical protein